MLTRKIISGIMVCIRGVSPIVYPGLTALGYYKTQTSVEVVKKINSAATVPTSKAATALNTNSKTKQESWSSNTQNTNPTKNPQPVTPHPAPTTDQVHMLARIIHAEAGGEPYSGQVAVGAVI